MANLKKVEIAVDKALQDEVQRLRDNLKGRERRIDHLEDEVVDLRDGIEELTAKNNDAVLEAAVEEIDELRKEREELHHELTRLRALSIEAHVSGFWAALDLYGIWREGTQVIGCRDTPIKDAYEHYKRELEGK